MHASSVEACVNSVDARRARIALLGADGMSERAIAERVGIAERHVPRIRARFIAGGWWAAPSVVEPCLREHALTSSNFADVAHAENPSPVPLSGVRARFAIVDANTEARYASE